ncbi:uncharacterized protein Tco025E_00498, partial [Trypanosoma conorhini]
MFRPLVHQGRLEGGQLLAVALLRGVVRFLGATLRLLGALPRVLKRHRRLSTSSACCARSCSRAASRVASCSPWRCSAVSCVSWAPRSASSARCRACSSATPEAFDLVCVLRPLVLQGRLEGGQLLAVALLRGVVRFLGTTLRLLGALPRVLKRPH